MDPALLEYSHQPFSGTDIVAITLAIVALGQIILWFRDHEAGMLWLAAAFLLNVFLAANNDSLLPVGGEPNNTYLTINLAVHCCYVVGLARYSLIEARARIWFIALFTLPLLLTAVAVLLGMHFARPLAIFPMLFASLGMAAICVVAARREPFSGYELLVLGAIINPAYVLWVSAHGVDPFRARYYAWPPVINFGIILLVVAVMRRRRAVLDAERENRQLATLLRNTPEFIGVSTLDGQAVFINTYGRDLIGMRPQDSLDGFSISDAIHPAELKRLAGEILPHIIAQGHWSGEIAFRDLRDNAAIPMLTLGIRIDDSEGHPMQLAMVSRDLREAKRVEAEIRELEHAYLNETDRLQSELGHELHDGLSQELTGLSLLASAVAGQAQRGEAVSAEALAKITAAARQAIMTARGISRGLSPLTENAGELLKSLRLLVERAGASPPPLVRFHERGDEPAMLTREARNHLYRITQEALSNAMRHARATEIDVYFDAERDFVSVKVSDNGIGIGNGRGVEGLGMRTMRYRAFNIGATLTVRAGSGGGTTIQCEVGNRSGAGQVNENDG